MYTILSSTVVLRFCHFFLLALDRAAWLISEAASARYGLLLDHCFLAGLLAAADVFA